MRNDGVVDEEMMKLFGLVKTDIIDPLWENYIEEGFNDFAIRDCFQNILSAIDLADSNQAKEFLYHLLVDMFYFIEQRAHERKNNTTENSIVPHTFLDQWVSEFEIGSSGKGNSIKHLKNRLDAYDDDTGKKKISIHTVPGLKKLITELADNIISNHNTDALST